ncbi:SGNH/GDSL hydrolase family protein [Umezawaea tangerina]|uniref:GDSL-like lipase/acylhydrolase family protein n=1 Tax=Umezawaea tangerina TaxID=84725 RepID=A0A2T0SZJ2_9PSEU|nr:SGNH/GDSL hydrolase family protein [Umezawaea tangerina]PRY38819.1 GDSL-like lipase/acylhydrolase family protein [Umezawaea tangerina]
MRARWLVLLVVAAFATGTAPAVASAPLRYAALGDSSASGPLIPNQIDERCLRSDRNWPHVLAGRLRAALVDVTCSGARTVDLAGRQSGVVPPQYDALRRDTELVTIAIAANDIAMYEAFTECATPAPPPVPAGPTCQQKSTSGGVDKYTARTAATAPKVGAALEEIHRRSPNARVVVVGYLTYWRSGGCYPTDPYLPADADYIQSRMDGVATMLAQQANAHGATFVDIRRPSSDRGLCEQPARRWLEGGNPASPTYPYHPNAAGMAAAASIIAGVVQTRR